MKFTWLSNAPWSPTGYGNQTKVFVPRLVKKGHEIAIIAFFGLEGGILGGWNGIQIYPKFMDAFGNDVMIPHTKFFGTNIMFSLLDTWVIQTDNIPPDIAWIPWFPIDSDPIPPNVYHTVKKAFAPIVFSKFGINKMNEAGLACYYVPHGVDTKEVFYPEDMEESRNNIGLPSDKFIVGMNAANKGNPSRKAFAENIQAFAQLRKKYDDVVLYLHTMTEGFQGVDLPKLIKALDLVEGKDVIFPSQYHMTIGLPDRYMRNMYNSLDVLLNVSMGEGFGIPIVESQACGTPVIVGDWTSMGELCFSGWKIPIEESHPVWTPLFTYQYLPDSNAIYNCLLDAYLNRGNQELRDQARIGALEYDADKITDEYWIPVLNELDERIQDHFSHKWATIGLYNREGKMMIPSTEDGDRDGLIIDQKGNRSIVPNLFSFEANGVDFSDLFWAKNDPIPKIVIKEIGQDYDFDSIPFQDGDFVIDIGAHIGLVTFYLDMKFKNLELRIKAFEPDPENYKYLEMNCRELGHVIPYQLAVTGDGRSVIISPHPVNSGGSNIYGSEAGIPVDSLTLEGIIGKDKIKLLKIDCEGAEYEIIEANPEILKNVEYIRGEIHSVEGKNPTDLLNLILKYIDEDHVRMTINTNERN